MDDNASFGAWIKRRRKALDLTQEELAQRVGCSLETIRKIEADARRPSKQIAELLADQLGLAPSERATFLQAARAERGVEQLAPPSRTVPQAAFVPAATLPHGTVTFLFTDIEGSTQLWEQHPQTMPAALAQHHVLLRAAIQAQAGVVFQITGDAFCAAFPTAPAALCAALAAQRALQAATWGPTGRIGVRMALHTATVALQAGDYPSGPHFNRLARLLNAGHGGQVLLSLATTELLREHLPPDAALHDLGAHRLKDLSRPEQIFQLGAADLPAAFPPLRTLDPRRTNLPAQPTVLIGRERETAAVAALLQQADVRLVTLTGPGGTGKTRLALQVAAELLDDFADGSYFVNLAPISDPDLVAPALAQALGVTETGGRPLVELLNAYLREKHLLLLLDNFEQVLDAAPLLAELLATAPRVKILVTSREVLHLRGEKEFPVLPLALPDPQRRVPVEVLSQYAAVQLFIVRAQDVKPDFVVTNQNAPAVAEICARLDGLPLAIELAAARVKLFVPAALLGRLAAAGGLATLTGGARDLPARQQTLRATIAWSHDVLHADEQILFQRLAVFVGGCTLEAAEAVCTAEDDLPQEILDGLASLSDKSLLRPAEGGAGEPRFTMLETIREYALERLEGSNEAEALRQRHAAYFLDLAEQAVPQLHRAQQQTWLAHLEAEHDNLRAALTWALDEKATRKPEGTLYEDIVTLSLPHLGTTSRVELGLRLAGALAEFWSRRGYLSEGRGWLEASLARAPAPTAARARALNALGDLIFWVDPAAVPALHEESLAIGQALGDKQIVANAYYGLGKIAENISGDCVQGATLYEQALALYRELGDTVGRARVLNTLGLLVADLKDYPRAMALCEESLALYRELGDTHGIIWALTLEGMVARWSDIGRAAALLAEGLALCRELGNKADTAWTLIISGDVAQFQGNYRSATMFLEEALALSREIGNNMYTAWALDNLGDIALYHGDAVQAAALFESSLSLFQEVGHKGGIAQCLAGFAGVACAAGQAARAARLCSAAEALYGDVMLMEPADRAHYDRTVAATRAELDEAVFAAAWSEGRAMTLEQAIADVKSQAVLEVPGSR